MPIPSQPDNLIPQPFAQQGNFDIIPDTTGTPGRASFSAGFPQVTQLPLREGGIAPNRLDFNGVLHLLTAFGFWQQSGGQWTYATGLNYTLPNIVYHDEKLWWCLRENGPDSVNGPHEPGTDETYWTELLAALASMAGGGIGGGFNTRTLLSSSQAWTSPVSGTLRYKIISGGGAGGKGGGPAMTDWGGGGAQGGSSSFAGIAAQGGSGGGGGGSNGGGGGGGGAGEIVEGYLSVTEGQVITVVVGQGAQRTTGVATGPQKGAGPYGGDGANRPATPGSGAAGASTGSSNFEGTISGTGGPGARNGTGYGGGGGGGGGYESAPEDGQGGAAADGAEYGGYGSAGRYGGAGGAGAVILEYYVRGA